jgi:hypothetical protein
MGYGASAGGFKGHRRGGNIAAGMEASRTSSATGLRVASAWRRGQVALPYGINNFRGIIPLGYHQ